MKTIAKLILLILAVSQGHSYPQVNKDFSFPTDKNFAINDTCILEHSGRRGACKPISECESAKQNLNERKVRPTICFFKKSEPIVCCVNIVKLELNIDEIEEEIILDSDSSRNKTEKFNIQQNETIFFDVFDTKIHENETVQPVEISELTTDEEPVMIETTTIDVNDKIAVETTTELDFDQRIDVSNVNKTENLV